jgi:hypothetical protein
MRDTTQRFFDAKPESVALARDFATRALAAWGLSATAEDVRLCVSELASNSLVHGTRPGHGFLVRPGHGFLVRRGHGFLVRRGPIELKRGLVGQSVVFSTEAIMRGRGDIPHGRPALVIGFGKLGSSIARLLHAKGIQVTVFDIDPVRRTQALAQGFTVARDRESALAGAGLVLCATGAVSLRGEDFPHLRNGAYVATVTSSTASPPTPAAIPNVTR